MSASVYSLTDDERAWLTTLNADLWPDDYVRKNSARHRINLTALRPLTVVELSRVCELIETRSLVTEMFSTSMFGGYGMNVFEHEPFPGTGPVELLALVEGHMPGECKKASGQGRDDAWECFSKFTHSERNITWLKGYKMGLPRDRGYYDY